MVIPDALNDMNVGGLLVLNGRGEPSLIMKLSEEIHFDETSPMVYGSFEWYRYEQEGVVIRTLVQLYTDLEHLDQPAYVETFVNPNDEQEKQVLSALASVSYVWCLAWASKGGIFLGQRRLIWENHHRKEVARLLEKSEGTSTLWPEAKIRCMKENPFK